MILNFTKIYCTLAKLYTLLAKAFLFKLVQYIHIQSLCFFRVLCPSILILSHLFFCKHLLQSFWAIITNHHRLGDYKQQKFDFSQFWRLRKSLKPSHLQTQCLEGLVESFRLVESCLFALSSWRKGASFIGYESHS